MKVLKRLLKNPTSLAGIVLLVIFVIIAIAAPRLAPPPENSRDAFMIPRDGFSTEPRPPSAEHIMGTTEGQYDIYYGVIWGTRTAFRIGVVITLFTTVIGLLIGAISGFYGGWVDEVLMRFVDVLLAIPSLPILIVLSALLGTSVWNVVILVAMFSWMGTARLVRSQTLTLKERPFVEAAKASGATDGYVMITHILPNVMPLEELNSKINRLNVRAVRGGQSSGSLEDNGDGTITDPGTGLMWEIKTDDGGPRDMDNACTWQEALAYCENLTLADYNDWRLPNRNELQSLIDYGRYGPSINPVFPYVRPSSFWSSTTNAGNPLVAWLVNFYDGDVSFISKSGDSYVRAVRAAGGDGATRRDRRHAAGGGTRQCDGFLFLCV